MTQAPPIVVSLNAVICAADSETPFVLSTRRHGLSGLPHGRFDPENHRTFELGVRQWVGAQTGFELGFVEQLYTFGDRGRELPQADLSDAPSGARLVSVSYLGLTAVRTDMADFSAVWRDWYAFLPWEDHRGGRPALLDRDILPALRHWATTDERRMEARLTRIRNAFGAEGRPWIEEGTLDRYELLYEAGLAPEAARDRASDTPAPLLLPGEGMMSDHRRILATAIGRLRGKMRYRPVVFELTQPEFTLLCLQRTVEAILGRSLHKQNFRRALERSRLVKGLGIYAGDTGGRPAELFCVNVDMISGSDAEGVPAPRLHG
jgi:hypothetical protein